MDRKAVLHFVIGTDSIQQAAYDCIALAHEKRIPVRILNSSVWRMLTREELIAVANILTGPTTGSISPSHQPLLLLHCSWLRIPIFHFFIPLHSCEKGHAYRLFIPWHSCKWACLACIAPSSQAKTSWIVYMFCFISANKPFNYENWLDLYKNLM